MESLTGNIMTLSNSIIGVSILAMPFCFKQCGIILAILMLIISSIVTRLACHFLLKSAIMARRRTFELLAFHAFGTAGKFAVELGVIGFLMGTCIAFFVVIGDLGPAILAKLMEIKSTDVLRLSVLIGVAIFFILPLGLLKNVDSLHSVCTATIGFYFCLILKTISESSTNFSMNLLDKVELWRPAGILQCLPIFSMALSCQTQLFEIYESVPNPSLDKMNLIVKQAINICVVVYICVGFFGYVAFCSQPFTGNILMSFSPSFITDVMKIGFVLSVAFSFPLVIFPCRASLFSFLFKKPVYNPYEGTSNYIPDTKFKFLTLLIIATSLTIGILIPNIEVVLGLIGSTIGIMICLIFPVTCFICISTKNTNERLLAQILLFFGVIVMVMGTYANLYAMEQINEYDENLAIDSHVDLLKNMPPKLDSDSIIEIKVVKLPEIEAPVVIEEKEEIRLEPPQPEEPQEENVKNKENEIQIQETIHSPDDPKVNEKIDKPELTNDLNEEVKNQEEKQNSIELSSKKSVEVDKDAIKKEEIEQEEEKNKVKETKEELLKTDLLKTLEKHKQEQINLIKEQKELIQELKKEKQDFEETNEKQENKIVQKVVEQLISGSLNQSLISKITKKEENKLPSNKLNEIKDPVAKKIIESANKNSINPVKIKQNLIPLPLAINNSVNIQKNHQVAENKDNFKENEIKIDTPTEIPLKNIDEPSKVEKEENNVPLKRDILAEETTANDRIKRDVQSNNNENCDVKEKNLPKIEPPNPSDSLKELPKPNLLKLESNQMIESIKTQLKIDSLQITKK